MNRSTVPLSRSSARPSRPLPLASRPIVKQPPATWPLTLSTTTASSVPPVHADRYNISLGPTALYDHPKLFLRQTRSFYLWPLFPHQAKSFPASGPAFHRPYPWPRAPSSTMWPLVLPTATTSPASPTHINQYSVFPGLTVQHDPAPASTTSCSSPTRYLSALSPLVRHDNHNASLHYSHNTRCSILKFLMKEVPPSSMLIFISLTKSRTPQKISEDHYLDQEPPSASVSWWKQTLRPLPVTDSGH